MKNYNPDVLTCLANLSNDEVFTPPVVVNRMLDLLPAELWRNPDARFLDPVSKTGVFLREIAKRLMEGLCERIPDRQQRADHIFTRQLFGIAITELTASCRAGRSIAANRRTGPIRFARPFTMRMEISASGLRNTPGRTADAAIAGRAGRYTTATTHWRATPTNLSTPRIPKPYSPI